MSAPIAVEPGYRATGAEQLLTLGAFPDLSLAQSRGRAAESAELLRTGGDPRQRAGGAPTFAAAARAWHLSQIETWSPAHAAEVLASLERQILPAIGAEPVDQLDTVTVARVLRAIERSGARETAGRVGQRVSAIFDSALFEGTITTNPAAKIGRALRPIGLRGRHAAVETIAEARDALEQLRDAGGAEVTRLAARFLALTAVRLGSIRAMRWSEVDADSWTIPAAHMKLSIERKADAAFDHVVPLSRAALEVLEQVRALGRGDELVFAGAAGAPIGTDAILALHRRAGLAGRQAPHGWRASFSTILNERRPSDRGAIDLALGHAGKDKVEGAYNRAALMNLREDLLEEWGDLLTLPQEALEHRFGADVLSGGRTGRRRLAA